MSGTATPAAINARVTVTAKNINGDSATTTFNRVRELEFNYIKGVVRVLDQEQGEFFFGIVLVTVTTVAIGPTATSVVIS